MTEIAIVIGFTTVLFLSFLALILVSYFWSRDRSELILPGNCPQIRGRYGLITGVTGNRIGPQIVVESLSDAEGLCSADPHCSAFSYIQGPQNGLTWSIDPTTLTPAERINSYLQQIPGPNLIS